jgi:hypothetical protein
MVEAQGSAKTFFLPVFHNYFPPIKTHYLLDEIEPQTAALFPGIRSFQGIELFKIFKKRLALPTSKE